MYAPIKSIVSVLLAAGVTVSGTPVRPAPFLASQGTPPTYAEDQHWGGFDAPDDHDVSLTQIMWIQQTPSASGGTLVFEVRHSDGTLLCSGSTDCDVAQNTDVRASCSATLAAGEHANLLIGTSSTCATLPGGRINVSGYYSP